MSIPELKIGEHTATIPIVQGGMGVGISLSGLASAVAREGAIGVVAAAGIGFLRSDYAKIKHKANLIVLKEQIKKAKELAKGGIIGVNIMVALTDYESLVRGALESEVDIIFSGAGLPLNLPKLKQEFPDSKTALVPIISSPRAAAILCKKWKRFGYLPDGFVLEGPMAGGHLGFSENDLVAPPLIQDLLIETKKILAPFEDEAGRTIPIIVAGGVYTGADIAQMLRLGASGVQMGTRFVATEECDADVKFKQEFIRARKEDIVIIKSPVGLPGRAIKNEFLLSVEKGEKTPFSCPYHCIKTCDPKKAPYCISLALINAQRGRLDKGFAFAGSNAYRVDKIISVKALIDELVAGIIKV
ncbi:MAG: nitronate monooxygenase family protein [Desulfonauticus sp.]|nr:nitronate monooxygenase family protein [Desulfonauticus sp.]